ncbi:hypothetical protein ACT29I_23735 [Saccharicrinis sp. GN24d3]
MKILIYSLIIILTASFMWSCETDGLFDSEQESSVVMWDAETYKANVIISPLEEKIDVIRLRLFGKKAQQDIAVQIELDPSTTALTGVEFDIQSTDLVIKEGESFVEVPFSIDNEKLEADVEKKVVLNIKTVGTGARNSNGKTTISLNKILYDVSGWEGDYIFEADNGDWTRDASVSATGKPYELVIKNFWGNGLEMEGTVDASDLNNIKFIVPAGTKLDNGWDSKGAWWLKNDLIATLDDENFIMDIIQFDYVTDDGSEGSFPWCSAACKMIKK